MIQGSFLNSVDVEYSGSLNAGIQLNTGVLVEALRSIRKTYFRHRALYRSLNGNEFGERLRKLYR